MGHSLVASAQQLSGCVLLISTPQSTLSLPTLPPLTTTMTPTLTTAT
jgi:hypothetical protein